MRLLVNILLFFPSLMSFKVLLNIQNTQIIDLSLGEELKSFLSWKWHHRSFESFILYLISGAGCGVDASKFQIAITVGPQKLYILITSIHVRRKVYNPWGRVIIGCKAAGFVYAADLHLNLIITSPQHQVTSRPALGSRLPSFAKLPLLQNLIFILHYFVSFLTSTQALGLVMFSLSNFVWEGTGQVGRNGLVKSSGSLSGNLICWIELMSTCILDTCPEASGQQDLSEAIQFPKTESAEIKGNVCKARTTMKMHCTPPCKFWKHFPHFYC